MIPRDMNYNNQTGYVPTERLANKSHKNNDWHLSARFPVMLQARSQWKHLLIGRYYEMLSHQNYFLDTSAKAIAFTSNFQSKPLSLTSLTSAVRRNSTKNGPTLSLLNPPFQPSSTPKRRLPTSTQTISPLFSQRPSHTRIDNRLNIYSP